MMGGTTRLLAVLALVLALSACAPVEAGPELPRPSQTATPAPPITAMPSTTTTIDPADLMAQECPTQVCLVYHLASGARWSDGTPLSAADFAATVSANVDPLADQADEAYELVTAVDAVDASRVRVALSEPYGAWQGLFARVLPSHGPVDASAMPSTGPFLVEDWVPGDRIVVGRNDDWWSDVDRLSMDPIGTVESIEFVFIADVEDRLLALEDGEVDVVAVRPTLPIVEGLAGSEDVTYAISPGPLWEHIDFHHQDELLSRLWLRDAMDLAIDRQKILDRTVRLLDPSAEGLASTIWMANTPYYETHYADRHDPIAAEELLVANGCSRSGGVYVCGDRPLSFVWASTADPDRREIFASVREDLAAIGIEVVPDLRTPSAFVNREFLFGGPDVWQMVNFSWRAAADPLGSEATYFCEGSDFNVNRYCSADVEDLVRAAGRAMDPADRASLYNEADRLYLGDLALIPLYQEPMMMAWSADLTGPTPNYSTSTNLWNVASWAGRDHIIVALPGEPTSLDGVSTADENANLVLSSVLYGAFGMTPGHEHVPVLVDSVDIVEP